MTTIAESDWTGCYRHGWGRRLTPESMSHPAKISLGLAARIYRHLSEDLALPSGSLVLDCFAGVAGTAYHAGQHGYRWIGVELEPRFVEMGRANIARWSGELFRPGAELLQGDSRRLVAILAAAGVTSGAAVVASPPFADTLNPMADRIAKGLDPQKSAYPQARSVEYLARCGNGLYGSTPGQLRACVSSPPFLGVTATQDPNFLTPGERGKRIPSKSNLAGYGSTPGQLGAVVSLDDSNDSTDNHGHENNHRTVRRRSQRKLDRSQGGILPNVDPPRSAHGRGSDSDKLGCPSAGLCDGRIEEGPILEGQEATAQDGGGQGEEAERAESLPLEGGKGTETVSEDRQEGSMRTVRGPAQSLRASSRLRSLQRQPGQLAGPLRVVPPGAAQGRVLEGEARGPADTQIHRAVPLEEGRQTPRFAVVSSPPYEGSAESGARHGENGIVGRDAAAGKPVQPFRYSDQSGGENLGGKKRDAFWEGAGQILAQLAQVLPSGAPACWVLKAFVRDGQLVPFPEQWEAACVAAGFCTLHRHRALLTDPDTGKRRASFFRRLHEARGSPSIDAEIVLCTVRL